MPPTLPPLRPDRGAGPARAARPPRASAGATRLLAACAAASLAALAACADPLVAPPPAATATSIRPALAPDARTPNAQAERVTVTRTTERFDTRHGRRVSLGREVKTRTFGRGIAVVRGSAVVAADASPPTVADVSDLPPAGLSFEVTRGVAAPGVAWRERHALAGVPGVEVETSGVGDSPALVLNYFRDGALAQTVRQTFERRGRRWDLVRREITTPDGALHDVVEVARDRGARNEPFAFADPRDRDPRAAADGALDFGEECDPCKAQREARSAAFEHLLWEEATAALACALTPAPANAIACAAGAVKIVQAYVAYVRANTTLEECLANPPECPKPPTPIPPPPPLAAGAGGTATRR